MAASADGISARARLTVFGENTAADTELLAVGGTLAAYAAGQPRPAVPFWELLF